MSVLVRSTTFVWNISHSEKNSARCNHKCKVHVIFSHLKETRIFSTDFRKKSSNIKFHENSWGGGAMLFHADVQAFTSELRVAFRNISEASKKNILISVIELTDNKNERVVSVLDISLRKRKCDINNDDCSITGSGDEGGGGECMLPRHTRLKARNNVWNYMPGWMKDYSCEYWGNPLMLL